MEDKLKKTMGKRLQELRSGRKLTRSKLAEILGVSPSTIRDWEKGVNSISPMRLEEIAEKLSVSKNYFLDEEITVEKDKMIPILGNIRAGLPMFAEENIQGYVKPPKGIKADFCLFVEGDSMIPVYHPNTIIYIKEQPIVEHGEVAAVLVENENATLKKVRFRNGMIQLIPFNTAKYDIMEYKPGDIKIIGKVVYPNA